MCPNCNNVDSMIMIDVDTQLCKHCGMTYTKTMEKKVSIYQDAADPRPPLPTGINVAITDVVCDFFSKGDKAVFTSRAYCPKLDVAEETFDPTSPAAKFYLKFHAKRFKNRRRYMYEKQRKAKENIVAE